MQNSRVHTSKLLVLLCFTSFLCAKMMFFPCSSFASSVYESSLLLPDSIAREFSGPGLSISMSGDVIVVGDEENDVKGADAGAVHIFAKDHGGAGNWGRVALVFHPDQAVGFSAPRFGKHALVSGDTLVVACRDANPAQGVAYVFSRHQGGVDNWGFVALLTPQGDSADSDAAWFSPFLAVEGDTIVVGRAYGASLYIFSQNQGGANAWGQSARLERPERNADSSFYGAALSNGVLVAARANQLAAESDAVSESNEFWVYEYASGWNFMTALTHPEAPALYGSRSFGVSFALSGEHLAVADPAYGADERQSGAVYVFCRENSVWLFQKKITPPTARRGLLFGESIALVDGFLRVSTSALDGTTHLYQNDLGGAGAWGLSQSIAPLGRFAYRVQGAHTAQTMLLAGFDLDVAPYVNFTVYSTAQAPAPALPVVSTSPVSSVETVVAIGGGDVQSNGGAPVMTRGVCWSTSPGPTLSSAHTSDGGGLGAFSSSLQNLQPGTTYYVRAYATNSAGAAYGQELSFTTLDETPLPCETPPEARTALVHTIGEQSADVNVEIIAENCAPIQSKGLVWNTGGAPAMGDNVLESTVSGDSFTLTLGGLAPGTTYYVRAFARSAAGVGYGETLSFRTADEGGQGCETPPDVLTQRVLKVTAASAKVVAKVIAENCAPVVRRGVVWSTGGAPSLSDGVLLVDGDLGRFTATLENLERGVTYHVRAFAESAAGVGYGETLTFTTTSKTKRLYTRNESTGVNHIEYLSESGAEGRDELPYVGDLSWVMRATLDFNGDSIADVMWWNRSMGTLGVEVMNESGHESYVVVSSAPTHFEPKAAGDFFGDGGVQIIWRNKQSGTMYMQYLNGLEHVRYEYFTQYGDENTELAGAADFDGDGVTDLLWRNHETGENTLTLMSAGKLNESKTLQPITLPNVYAAGVTDLNMDGHVDILWREQSTGRIYAEYLEDMGHVEYALVLELEQGVMVCGVADK